MKICYLNYFRKGRATNSSSTHSVIYRNKDEIFADLNVFEEDYYDRYTETIAASKEAKIKYVYACIYRDEVLSDMLMNKYPEMKEYKELAEKAITENDWYVFGEHSRGSLHPFDNDVTIAYQMLCNIIDNPEIVIVGGSDETDFVYDTCKGHKEINHQFSKGSAIKNGNYYLGYSYWGDKIRLCITPDDKLIPKHPELIDLLITKRCYHNCPMCYNNSHMHGEHASLDTIKAIVNGLKMKTEFSIGGGDITAHPQLKEILGYLKEKGHIVNVTIHKDDVPDIIHNEQFKKIFNECVDGIGVSVFNKEDVVNYHVLSSVFTSKDVVMHIIPEMLGLNKTLKILEYSHSLWRNTKVTTNVLFLGYKQVGRALKTNVKSFSGTELYTLFESYNMRFSVDTSFASKYQDWLSKNTCEISYTTREGEFSMYIDAITATAYTCSYDLSKPHPLEVGFALDDIVHNYKTDEIFKVIRKENGFD